MDQRRHVRCSPAGRRSGRSPASPARRPIKGRFSAVSFRTPLSTAPCPRPRRSTAPPTRISPRSKGFGRYSRGAALGRPDRRHQGVLRAHDDDRQVGPALLMRGIRSRPSSSGITTSVMTTSPRRPAPIARASPHSPPHITLWPSCTRGLGQHQPDGAVVVGDQDCGGHSPVLPKRRSPKAARRKHGPPRRALAFDDAVVVGDQLRHQGKPRPRPPPCR